MGSTILLIVILITLVLSLILGFYRGFIKEISLFFSALMAIILTCVFINPLTDVVCTHTSLDETVANMCRSKVESHLPPELMASPAEQLTTLQQASALEMIPLSESTKELLTANNNQNMYELLGISNFVDYICSFLARIIVKILIFLVAFLLLCIMFRLILLSLETVTEMPLLRGINRMTGALAGAAVWLVFLWIFFLLVTIFCTTGFGSAILTMIAGNPFLSFLYDHNILLSILTQL